VLCCREENGSWVEEQKLCVELLVLCCAVERRMVAGLRRAEVMC